MGNTDEASDHARGLLRQLGLSVPPLDPGLVVDQLGFVQTPLDGLYPDDLTPDQRRVMDKLVGAARFEEKVIFVKPDLPSLQLQWLLLHEAGHAIIPWHEQALYLDQAYTLAQSVRDTMEREANAFAAELRFLGEVFDEIVQDYPFGVEAVRSLADIFGASLESTLIHYVERANERCACYAFEPVQVNGDTRLRAQYFRKSRQPRFPFKFGTNVGDILPGEDQIVEAYLSGGLVRGATVKEDFRFEDGQVVESEYFSNSHKVFVLCRPRPVFFSL